MSFFEVFEGKTKGDWFYRLKGGNGETMNTSQSYTRQSDAVRAVEDCIDAVAGADPKIHIISGNDGK